MPTLRATPDQILANLFADFTRAGRIEIEEGKAWYQSAHDQCQALAEEYHVPLWMVVGITAALSPRCRWEDNISYAEVVLIQGNGEGIPLYNDSKSKAERILKGEHPRTVLGGPKTKAFYDNILDPDCSDCACIDTWMIRSAYADMGHIGSMTPYEYTTIEQAVKKIAERVNLLPHQVQAIIWVVVRTPQPRLI